MKNISVIIPAKNEQHSIGSLVEAVLALPDVGEVIVVDDGSTDKTYEYATASGAKLVTHRVSLGNGAAIKRGAREASGEWLLFMDADGQHLPEDISKLTSEARNCDMVVGARSPTGQSSVWRRMANGVYNRFASFVTGQQIEDLTSGFRLVRADKFKQFLSLLPNGFSYPTTSTMAFFRSGYQVSYVNVNVQKRVGKSHIRPMKDGIRFLIIIFKVATLYSPLKVFLPLAVLSFSLGFVRYGYTYLTMGQFTNMSALLMVTGVQIFLIGLVSEQITALMYQPKDR